jgi:hypothetical protein
MNNFYPDRLLVANDLIADRLREACIARLVATSRAVEQGRPNLRRSIGQSMIRIGERLAAEPPLQSARSR